MTDRFAFPLLPSFDPQVHRVGKESTPVIVVDRVMQRPVELVRYACHDVAFDMLDDGTGKYPGVRAPAPLNYVAALVRALDPILRSTYKLAEATLVNAECTFSIVSTPRSRLHPLQCVPHIDTTYPLQFAILHFLCEQPFGGTAFFRQNLTGLEVVLHDCEADYLQGQRVALANPERRQDFVGDRDPDYTQMAEFGATFDRLLIYPSSLIHSGVIKADTPLTADPHLGRLTSNIFVTYRP